MTKTTLKIISFVCLVIAFGSGFIFLMTFMSYQSTGKIIHQGQYVTVKIVNKYIDEQKRPNKAPYKTYHLVLLPEDMENIKENYLWTGILEKEYTELNLNQKINAWILEEDVVIDYGKQNAGSESVKYLIIFIVSSIFLIIVRIRFKRVT